MNVAHFSKHRTRRGVRRLAVLYQNRCCADGAAFTPGSAVAIAGAAVIRILMLMWRFNSMLMMCVVVMHRRAMLAFIGDLMRI